MLLKVGGNVTFYLINLQDDNNSFLLKKNNNNEQP